MKKDSHRLTIYLQHPEVFASLMEEENRTNPGQFISDAVVAKYYPHCGCLADHLMNLCDDTVDHRDALYRIMFWLRWNCTEDGVKALRCLMPYIATCLRLNPVCRNL